MLRHTLLDEWHDETKYCSITTLCENLDEYLDNGIQVTKITEFCGGPGSGKTQMCLQLCVNVQISKNAEGCEGKAIFIDTNQGFNPFRLKEIATFTSQRLNTLLSSPSFNTNNDNYFNSNTILENVRYIYCENHVILLAIIVRLIDILENDKKIKLIVIDSFSYIFRNFKCYAKRTGIIYQILNDLQIIADKYEIAIVLTNEITTKDDNFGNFQLCPALGDSYSHKIGQRIIFDKDINKNTLNNKNNNESYHIAYIEKSINSPQVYIQFKITNKGIRS